MTQRWFSYEIYPRGRGARVSHEELNAARLMVEAELKRLVEPYHWFTVLVRSKSVMFGVKTENGRTIEAQIEAGLKDEYPELVIGLGSEDPDNCEIIAIATQCRLSLEEKIPLATWNTGQIGFMVHCMLNPYGFDNEAWTYWTSLCCIDEDLDISDRDTRDVITLVRSFLEYKKGMEIEDDYEKVELLKEELEAFKTYLEQKLA